MCLLLPFPILKKYRHLLWRNTQTLNAFMWKKNVTSVIWKCAATGFASYSDHQEPACSGICSFLVSLSKKDYIIHAVIQTSSANCVWLGFPVTAVVYRHSASDLKHSKKIQGLTHRIPTTCKHRSEEYLRKCPTSFYLVGRLMFGCCWRQRHGLIIYGSVCKVCS